MKRILKNAKLIYWITKKLEEKYPENQIGKTKIQKLMYLLEDKLNEDFGYTMYHYGPYSSEIAESMNIANANGWIDMEWHVDSGYSMHIKDISDPLEIQDKEERAIEKIVNKYGNFKALELSIIATALYVKKNFGVDNPNDIIDIVLDLKPKNNREWIENTLNKAGII